MKRSYDKLFANVLVLVLILCGNIFAGSATKWTVDKAHTSIYFDIKHFWTTVQGKFDDYNIELYFDPDNLEGSSINVSIQVASINTGFEPRDNHLKTADWFDAEKFPAISFKSSKIMSKGDGAFVAKGKLKIKDVEMDIELPFKLLGVIPITEDVKDMLGGIDELASLEASYSLNRREFNVGEGTSTPGKAALLYRQFVGNEVNINIAIEVNRKTS